MKTSQVLRGLWITLCMAFSIAAFAIQPIAPSRSMPGANSAVQRPAEILPETAIPAPDIGMQDAASPQIASSLPNTPLFVLRSVRFEGGEGLPTTGLRAVAFPYLGRWVSLSDLEQLRYDLTRNLVDLGYINSGVIVPSGQRVRNGELRLRIVTGHLNEVRISGNRGLRADYIRNRIRPDPEEPLNQQRLQQRFQRLLDDPLIERIDGTLLPGIGPESAVLDLDVERARPWQLYARIDNYHPPSTGAEFLYLGGALHNLTGLGDLLEFYGALGLQSDNSLQRRGREGSIGWSVPVTAQDTRFFVRLDRTNASLLEASLRDLDIDSDTERFEVGFSHPFWRGARDEFSMGLLFSASRNTTTLLGERFSFSPGAVRGESRVSALRFYQDYLSRGNDSALGLRSIFSQGVDTLNATIHGGDLPDSQFFVWFGQAQYVRDLDWKDTRLVLRASVQLTPDILLPLERYAVGGARTVRGYRENELVGDAGYVASLELRYPLWRGATWGDAEGLFELALFTDVGSAWSHGRFERREDLFSAGVGVRFGIQDNLRAELYLAHAFSEPVPQDSYNWQDDGIHFILETEF